MYSLRLKKKLVNFLKSKTIFSAIFFVASAVVYFYYAYSLTFGPDFNDETKNIIGVWMLDSGYRLYRTMFDHHGPFQYMVAQLFYAISGDRYIPNYRLEVLLFSLVSILAIFRSSALNQLSSKFLACGLFCLGLLATQSTFGLVLGLYQIYAGHMFVWLIALVILPLVFDRKIKGIDAFLGGVSTAFIFFSAYSFVVSLLLFFAIVLIKNNGIKVAGLKKINAGILFSGLLVGILICLLWLLLWGDLLGYIVYHLYFNQFIYSKFTGFNILRPIHLLVPVLSKWSLYNSTIKYMGTYVVSSCLALIIFTFIFRANRTGRLNIKNSLIYVLFALGMVYTDPRAADDFQASTFIINSIGALAVMFAFVFESQCKNGRFYKAIYSFILLSLVSGLVVMQFVGQTMLYEKTPYDYYSLKGSFDKSNDPNFQKLRTIISDEDTVQQFAYNLNFYIQMGRMPATGNYWYLPWQKAYYDDPIFGYKIDVCNDLKSNPPKLISFSNQTIWIYKPDSYLGCVKKILSEKYVRSLLVKDVWIRADVAISNEEIRDYSVFTNSLDLDSFDSDVRLKISNLISKNYKLRNSKENQCVEVNEESRILSSDNCDVSSRFFIAPCDDSYRIIDSNSLECVETPIDADETKPVIVWPCHGVTNQLFTLVPIDKDSFYIKSVFNGLCVLMVNGKILQGNCGSPFVNWLKND